MTLDDWISAAEWEALMVADNAADPEDAAWGGFDNLRTMLSEAAAMPAWQTQQIVAAYIAAAARAFGHDYISI